MNTQDLHTRLDQLEKDLQQTRKQTLRWRGATFLLLLLTGFFAWTSFDAQPPIPDVVRAKRFEVVNDDGTALLVLRKTNTEGNTFEAGVAESFYKNGEKHWYLGQSKKSNSARLSLHYSNGKTMIASGEHSDISGNPVFNWYDITGNWLGQLGGDKEKGSIEVMSEGKNRLIYIGESTSGNGTVCTYNVTGTLIKCQ